MEVSILRGVLELCEIKGLRLLKESCVQPFASVGG